MRNIVNKTTNIVAKPGEPELLMLRMEAAAIRDQVVLNLNALIAKIDAALPEIEPQQYRPRSSDEYREMYGLPPRRRAGRGR